ncbi:hypothetical protein [Microcystis phage Mae-JY24]
MNLQLVFIYALIGFLSGVVVDLQAWALARKTEPDAPFDWSVALPRWFAAAITGAASGLGLSTAGSFAGVAA